jgi:UDP-N-acetylmuramyl pentapeptide phosphotransferase/UDP-N-acetylglucosamine-1-phosphate transferase
LGSTNAFNLIDGIDGLAGGLGFMSLVTLGIFLTISKDLNYAMIAFALAGALLGFYISILILQEYLWEIPVP